MKNKNKLLIPVISLFFTLSLHAGDNNQSNKSETNHQQFSQSYYDAEKVKIIRTHQLTKEGSYKDLRWSPAGDMFSAYSMVEPTGLAIFELKSNGKEAEIIDIIPEVENDNYAWSPDGKKIVYSKYEGGEWYSLWIAEIGRERGELKIVKNERLTFDGGLNPGWSLDGKQIVFSLKNWLGLAIIDSIGKNREVLIEGEEMWDPQFRNNDEVLYLKGPREKEIEPGMYTFGGMEVEVPAGIYAFSELRNLVKFNIKTKQKQIIFPDTIVSKFKVVTPAKHKTKIYYEEHLKTEAKTYIINYDMTNKAEIPSDIYKSLFTVSPDGSKIILMQTEHNPNETLKSSDLYVVNTDGSGFTQLTDTPEIHEIDPAWSSDGKWLLYFNQKNMGIYISKLTRHYDD